MAAGLVLLAICGWFEAALAPFGIGSSAVTFSAAAAVLAASAICGRRSRPAPEAPPQEAGLPAPGTLATDRSTHPDERVPRAPGRAEGPSLGWRGGLAWLLAALLALAVELWELFHSPRHLYPTLSSLANEVVGPGHRLARAAAFLCWGALGFILATGSRQRR